MWFDSWLDVLRVLLVGVTAYLTLVVAVRIAGKRSLAQLSAFDFVVTVALGSTLATILLSSDVSFVEGAVAIAELLLLQIAVSLLAAASPRVHPLVTAEPSLLVWQGTVDESALRRHRVARTDIEQAVRQSGYGDMNDVGALFLEANGRSASSPTTGSATRAPCRRGSGIRR